MILTAQSDKIQLISASAVTLDALVSFVDYNGMDASAPGRVTTAITAAATNDILTMPGGSVRREVEMIAVRNKHASSSCVVTLQISIDGTAFQLYKTTLNAGDTLCYNKSVGFSVLAASSLLFSERFLNADDDAGANSTDAQPWFVTSGAFTIPAVGTYRFNGFLHLATGATTHTTSQLFGGTATVTTIDYRAVCTSSAANTTAATFAVCTGAVATAVVLNATSTAVRTHIQIEGTVRFSAVGTFIPQFLFSADPTGTITPKRGSFFRMQQLGDSTFTSSGGWA